MDRPELGSLSFLGGQDIVTGYKVLGTTAWREMSLVCLCGSEEVEEVIQLSHQAGSVLCSLSTAVTCWTMFWLSFVVGCWLGTSSAPIPETSGMPCKSYPTEAGHGDREGNGSSPHCSWMAMPSPSIPVCLSPLWAGQGTARQGQT